MQIKQAKSEDLSQIELRRYRPLLMPLVIVLVCILSHGISIWNGYVLNDHFNIPCLRDITPKDWPQYLSNIVVQAMIDPFAEPMLKGSLAIDYLSARMAPALYHASNLLLHLAAVLSSYFLLNRLVGHFDKAQKQGSTTGNYLIPFIACLLFAAHPLTSEVVAYVSGRSAIFTLLYYSLALHFFLTGFVPPGVWTGFFGYLFCCISIFFSLFSSCQAITIPESMLVLGLMIKPAAEKWKDWIEERQNEFGAVLFIAAALPFIFLLPRIMPVGSGLGLPMLSTQAFIATQFKTLLTYYLRVFLVPVPLSIAPPYCLAESLADPLALGGMALFAFAVYMLYRLRRDPFSFFGLWLALIGLIPQSLIVTNEYVSGQRFYLSGFGLCVLCARLIVRYVAGRAKTNDAGQLMYEPRLVLPLVLVLVVFVGLSNWRDRAYTTDSALLRGALRANLGDRNLDKDGYLRALLSLMLVYDGGSYIDKGEIEAKRALEVNRKLPLAYLAMARQAVLRYDYDGAKYYADKTLELAREQKSPALVSGLAKGSLLIAMTNLGLFDDPKKLMDLAREAIAVDPSDSKLYHARALIYLSQHKPEAGIMALKELAHAKKLDFNNLKLNVPIIEAHLATGNPTDFESAYRAASQLYMIDPSDLSRMLLARASLETGRINKGFNILNDISKRNKGQIGAAGLLIMSGLSRQKGQVQMADIYLEQAKKIDPKIAEKVPLWLRVKPLTPIEQAREEEQEKGTPIQEKFPVPPNK